MGWIKGESGAPGLNDVLALRPSLATKFASFTESFAADGSVPSSTLALCRDQVRWVHGLESSEPAPQSEAERIALTIASKMPYGHHDISDADVAQLADHFGEAGVVSLLTAVAMYDATTRMERVLGMS